MKKKYWFTLLAGILTVGIYLSLPPYVFQATYYYLTNADELNKTDHDFSISNLKKWKSKSCALATIFKTKSGARLYYIGTLERFGRRFDVAFVSGGKSNSTCSPLSIYSSSWVKCDIPLDSSWVINYEIRDKIELNLPK